MPTTRVAVSAFPPAARPRWCVLTRERYDELLTAVPEDWQPFVAFMAGTGLRWSEATALTWADLQLDGPSPAVRVTKAWKRADGTGQTYEFGPPKTARGVRTVTLPAHVAAELRRIRDEARPTRAQLIFRAAQGGQLRHQNWHPRVWLPAVARAGLEPPPRIHDLRHSHVSWLVAAGVPLPVIQRRIGHEFRLRPPSTSTATSTGMRMPPPRPRSTKRYRLRLESRTRRSQLISLGSAASVSASSVRPGARAPHSAAVPR